MGDAEALLLVNDQQPQIGESDVFLEQPMSADDNVHLAREQPLQDLPLLGSGAEAGEHLHLDREGSQPLAEVGVVLLGQDGGRHQDGDLFAVHDGLEGRPQRHLGLTVAHVATDQPVHRLGLLHVGLDVGDDTQLILSLKIGESRLQIRLPGCVRSECVPGRQFAGRVEL
jgi:hypothetical protein